MRNVIKQSKREKLTVDLVDTHANVMHCNNFILTLNDCSILSELFKIKTEFRFMITTSRENKNLSLGADIFIFPVKLPIWVCFNFFLLKPFRVYIYINGKVLTLKIASFLFSQWNHANTLSVQRIPMTVKNL